MCKRLENKCHQIYLQNWGLILKDIFLSLRFLCACLVHFLLAFLFRCRWHFIMRGEGWGVVDVLHKFFCPCPLPFAGSSVPRKSFPLLPHTHTRIKRALKLLPLFSFPHLRCCTASFHCFVQIYLLFLPHPRRLPMIFFFALRTCYWRSYCSCVYLWLLAFEYDDPSEKCRTQRGQRRWASNEHTSKRIKSRPPLKKYSANKRNDLPYQ